MGTHSVMEEIVFHIPIPMSHSAYTSVLLWSGGRQNVDLWFPVQTILCWYVHKPQMHMIVHMGYTITLYLAGVCAVCVFRVA